MERYVSALNSIMVGQTKPATLQAMSVKEALLDGHEPINVCLTIVTVDFTIYPSLLSTS